jgi:hypothetical protein
LLVAIPDGLEIINLTASVLMAIAFIPYGIQLITAKQQQTPLSPLNTLGAAASLRPDRGSEVRGWRLFHVRGLFHMREGSTHSKGVGPSSTRVAGIHEVGLPFSMRLAGRTVKTWTRPSP